MLPPQLPEHSSHAQHSHSDYLASLKEHVKEDAEKIKKYARDEEDKIEGYVREEEDKFEGFVRKEEDMFGNFVRKEEDKIKEYVREEEEKLMHFRHGSIFGGDRHHSHSQYKRQDTMIGPNDDLEAGPPPGQGDGSGDDALQLDGTVAVEPEASRPPPSKAEAWSDMYRQCLQRSVPTDVKDPAETTALLSGAKTQSSLMPPPALKPAKARSPEQTKALDPKACITHFPSVTVIDDRKGHFRSVSLVSVKTSRSTGFERVSTHDPLELVKAREQEERNKLLKGLCNASRIEMGDLT